MISVNPGCGDAAVASSFSMPRTSAADVVRQRYRGVADLARPFLSSLTEAMPRT
jgi:hypothetical protein